jgi:hypothetical protein
MCLGDTWVWACMWPHRLECTRACDCARRRCSRCRHVRVGTSAGIYSQRTQSCTLYMYIYRCKNRKWARVCVLAYACDRVRTPTMREYAACVRVRRALIVRPFIDGTRTGIVHRCMMHACIYIHARLATPTNGSAMRDRRTRAPTCCVRPRARACVWDWARTHLR